MKRSFVAAALLFFLLWTIGPIVAQKFTSRNTSFQVEKLVDRLDSPWSIAFWGDRGILITERSGSLKLYSKGKILSVDGVPPVAKPVS